MKPLPLMAAARLLAFPRPAATIPVFRPAFVMVAKPAAPAGSRENALATKATRRSCAKSAQHISTADLRSGGLRKIWPRDGLPHGELLVGRRPAGRRTTGAGCCARPSRVRPEIHNGRPRLEISSAPHAKSVRRNISRRPRRAPDLPRSRRFAQPARPGKFPCQSKGSAGRTWRDETPTLNEASSDFCALASLDRDNAMTDTRTAGTHFDMRLRLPQR
jgi:hypothetical protein